MHMAYTVLYRVSSGWLDAEEHEVTTNITSGKTDAKPLASRATLYTRWLWGDPSVETLQETIV